MELFILILRIVSLILCILSAVPVMYFYIKVKRVLSDNSDETLDTVMPEMQSYIKKLSYSLFCLCGVVLLSTLSYILSYLF